MTEEFDYFRDRNIGKLFDLLLQVGTELHVTDQRLHAMEALLVRHGGSTTANSTPCGPPRTSSAYWMPVVRPPSHG